MKKRKGPARLLEYPLELREAQPPILRLRELAKTDPDVKLLLRYVEWLRRTSVHQLSDEYKVAAGMALYLGRKLWKTRVERVWRKKPKRSEEGGYGMEPVLRRRVTELQEQEIAFARARWKEHVEGGGHRRGG